MWSHCSESPAQETQYEQKLLNILKDQGTSYIVWQEIFDNGAKILPDTVIDVWKGGNWQEEMVKVRVPSNPCPFVSVRGSCGLAWRRAGRPSVLTAGRLWAVCAGYAGDEGRLQDSPLRSVLPQLHQLCVTSALRTPTDRGCLSAVHCRTDGDDWKKYYMTEPSNFTGGDAATEKGLVGGVEACFWSEFIDATNFISRTF